MKNCDFFEAVATWSDEMNSYYKDCIIDRTRLFEFMEMNDWFDLHVKYLSQREKLLLREKPFLMRSQYIQQLRGRIEIWLSAQHALHTEASGTIDSRNSGWNYRRSYSRYISS